MGKFRTEQWLNEPGAFTTDFIGENLYAVPANLSGEMMFAAKKLRTWKAGIRMGAFGHQKFVPDHDLAMSNSFSTAIPSFELSYEDAIRYLRKEEIRLPSTGKSDWGIVTFGKLPLGWVKILPNRVNNHLPKDWKIRREVL